MATLDDFSKEDLITFLAGVATNLIKDERAVEIAQKGDINRVWLSIYHSMTVGIDTFNNENMEALSLSTKMLDDELIVMKANAQQSSVQQ